jgi:hypothetical protein
MLSESYMHNNCCIVCERDIPRYKTKLIQLHDEDGNPSLDINADENQYKNLISVIRYIIVIYLSHCIANLLYLSCFFMCSISVCEIVYQLKSA